MKRIMDIKKIDSHTNRVVYSVSIPDNKTRTLKTYIYQEVEHKGYLKIKVLLSKNQKKKFLKYKKFPKLPKNPIVLSNIMKPMMMGENKKYRNKGYYKLHLGKQVFIVRLLKDTEKLTSEGYVLLQKFILKYFFQ